VLTPALRMTGRLLKCRLPENRVATQRQLAVCSSTGVWSDEGEPHGCHMLHIAAVVHHPRNVER